MNSRWLGGTSHRDGIRVIDARPRQAATYRHPNAGATWVRIASITYLTAAVVRVQTFSLLLLRRAECDYPRRISAES